MTAHVCRWLTTRTISDTAHVEVHDLPHQPTSDPRGGQVSDDLRPAPDWDFGGGWAEIERSRFGYWITGGYGPGVYEKHWFRFTHEGAKRRARRIVDHANREHQRHEQRERFT